MHPNKDIQKILAEISQLAVQASGNLPWQSFPPPDGDCEQAAQWLRDKVFIPAYMSVSPEECSTVQPLGRLSSAHRRAWLAVASAYTLARGIGKDKVKEAYIAAITNWRLGRNSAGDIEELAGYYAELVCATPTPPDRTALEILGLKEKVRLAEFAALQAQGNATHYQSVINCITGRLGLDVANDDAPKEIRAIVDDLRKLAGQAEDWHKVVVQCEEIIGTSGTAKSPLLSNMPNLVRDLKTQTQTLQNRLSRKTRRTQIQDERIAQLEAALAEARKPEEIAAIAKPGCEVRVAKEPAGWGNIEPHEREAGLFANGACGSGTKGNRRGGRQHKLPPRHPQQVIGQKSTRREGDIPDGHA
jgi:hypothetical protein